MIVYMIMVAEAIITKMPWVALGMSKKGQAARLVKIPVIFLSFFKGVHPAHLPEGLAVKVGGRD
jgi:hypothetical protein